jgi:hypothetical protein
MPRHLPIAAALAFGGGFLVFGFSAMHAESSIGRPSSTSALGYIFIPIYAVGFAGFGFISGLLGRRLWARRFPTSDSARPISWISYAVLLVVLVSCGFLGASLVAKSEQDAQPAVVIDRGIFIREMAQNNDETARGPTTLYDSLKDDSPRPFSWGSKTVNLNLSGGEIQIGDPKSSRASISTSALEYVTKIEAVSFRMRSAPQELLALVISGRATGRRAVVLILNDRYEVLFEERLDRFWELRDSSLEIRSDSQDRSEFVVIGPRCSKSLVLHERGAV